MVACSAHAHSYWLHNAAAAAAAAFDSCCNMLWYSTHYSRFALRAATVTTTVTSTAVLQRL
jgi:hypothetical protein